MSKIRCICINCDKELYRYPSQILGTVFCSRKCRSDYHKKNFTTELTCEHCDKVYRKKNSDITGERNYCSKECKDNWQKEGLRGKNNPFYGKTHNKESLRKMSLKLKLVRPKGKDSPNYKRIAVKCEVCGETRLKIPYLIKRNERNYCSVECHSIGKSEYGSGVNNPNYNPTLTELERSRNRTRELGYAKFRADVFKRDGEKCVICNSKDNLIVHHLNSHHWDKENRTNPENGVTLCVDCHTEFHQAYGYRFNTKQQFKEHIKSI